MKILSKVLTGVVAAASIVALAGSASAAALIQVGTSGLAGSNQVTWDGTGPGAGTFTVSGITTILNFDDALYNDGFFGQQAVLTISASTTGVLSQALPNFTQSGITGYFEFRSADLSTMLLRGDFSNFWLTGVTGDASGNLTSVGGQLNLTSDLVDLSFLKQDNALFGFTNIHPAFGITGGQLNDFQANNLTGSFGGAIPEPATWGLMLMGFGGLGALLRRNRRALAFA